VPSGDAQPEYDELRASDSERDEVAKQLHDHFSEGRLTMEELSERIDDTYRAKTRGELRHVLRQLPAPVPPPAPAPRPDPRAKLRFFAQMATPSIIAIGIWLLGGQGSFWPGWVILVSAVIALRRWARQGRRRQRAWERSVELGTDHRAANELPPPS